VDVKKGEAATKEEKPLPPADGWLGWTVVLGMFLSFLTLGALQTFTLFVEVYQTEFEVSRAAASTVLQVQTGCMTGLGLFTGRFTDILGTRKVYLLGVVLVTAGYLTASVAQTFSVVILGHGVLIGSGASCIFMPAMSVVPGWFNKRRGLAVSLGILGTGVGSASFAILVEFLIRTRGFRVTHRIMGAIAFCTLLTASFLIRRRLPPAPRQSMLKDLSILSDRNFIIMASSANFFNIGFTIVTTYQSPFITDLGFSSQFAGQAVALIGVGSAVGRVTLGVIADRVGHVRSYRIVFTGTAICCAFWWFCRTQPLLLTHALFLGWTSGGFIALYSTVMSIFFGTERLATALGILGIAILPGVVLGPLFGGLLRDNSDSFRNSAILSGICSCLGATILVLLPNKQIQMNEEATLERRLSIASSQQGVPLIVMNEDDKVLPSQSTSSASTDIEVVPTSKLAEDPEEATTADSQSEDANTGPSDNDDDDDKATDRPL